MGHAFHFLERLIRTEDSHLKQAMELYYQPKLLRGILEQIPLAPHHKRIALSLDPEDNGPFLIITSGGNFVTCLAKGMSPHPLYTIKFERYQVLLNRASSLISTIEKLESKEGTAQVREAIFALTQQDLFLDQERFDRLAALYELLRHHFLTQTIDFQISIKDAFTALQSGKLSSKSRKHKQRLHDYRQQHLALGHLILLSTLQGERGLTPIFERIRAAEQQQGNVIEEDFDPLVVIWPLSFFGDIPLIMRGLWSIGRMGKSVWPSLKKTLRDQNLHFTQWRMAFFGSMVLAARYKSLQTEITKVIFSKKMLTSKQGFLLYQETSFDSKDKTETWIRLLLSSVFISEKTRDLHASFIRQEAFRWMSSLPIEPIYHTPEEFPLEQAYPFVVSTPENIIEMPSLWNLIQYCIPWLSQAEARDFYLPQSITKQLQMGSEWRRTEEIYLYKTHSDGFVKKKPTKHKQAKPRPNHPCPCQSGKKYKRCCIHKTKQ